MICSLIANQWLNDSLHYFLPLKNIYSHVSLNVVEFLQSHQFKYSGDIGYFPSKIILLNWMFVGVSGTDLRYLIKAGPHHSQYNLKQIYWRL